MSRNSSFYKNLSYWKGQKTPPKGKQYTDPDFPPEERSLIGKNSKGEFIDKVNGEKNSKKININDIVWKRASDIYKDKKYSIFGGKIDILDFAQGFPDNSYFLTSLYALSDFPNLIYQIFKINNINQENYYEIIFFIDGFFQIVLIDDYLPVDKETNEFIFSKPNYKNEIWICLLEKAWAKINGGYSNIIGGKICQVLETITGFPSSNYVFSLYQLNNLWEKVKLASNTNSIISCSLKKNQENYGLMNSESYTILGCYELETKGNKVKLIKIRNPWAMFDWKGEWSDESSLWGEEEKNQVNFNEKESGTFFMGFEDFFKRFSSLKICYILFESFSKSYVVSGSSINNGNIFNIFLEEDSLLTVSLIKKMWRFNRDLQNIYIPSYLAILKYDPEKGEDDNNYFTDYDAKNESFESTTLTKFLPSGYYLIYAYHDLAHSNDKTEDKYIVKIDCDTRFRHKLMPNDNKYNNFPVLKLMITQSILSAKKDFNYDSSKDYYSFSSQFMIDGLGHRLIYNSNETNWLCYKENCDGLKNMFILSPFEKETNEFDWYIPPRSFNIILGMCEKSDLPCYFGLKAKSYYLDTRPLGFREPKLNIKIYASNLVKGESCNYDSYFDYISLPLEKTRQELIFEAINLDDSKNNKEEIEKRYPEIMKLVGDLPLSLNESSLCWVEVPYENVVYIGQVNKNKKKEGRGAIIFDNVDYVVVGQFRDGSLNGKGTVYDKSLTKKSYEGYFVYNQKHGKGTVYLSNGDKFDGDFKNDLMNGYGYYFFKCEKGEKIWEGRFTEDKMNGEGIYTDIDGIKKTLKFKDGIAYK